MIHTHISEKKGLVDYRVWRISLHHRNLGHTQLVNRLKVVMGLVHCVWLMEIETPQAAASSSPVAFRGSSIQSLTFINDLQRQGMQTASET